MTNDQDDGEFAHPEATSNKSRDAQGSGVVAKPGKVESNFQPKVLRNLAWTWIFISKHLKTKVNY